MSLSNLIKSNRYVPLGHNRKVEPPGYRPYIQEEETSQDFIQDSETDESHSQDAELQLQEAKRWVDEHICVAKEEASRMISEASKQIDEWWDQRRKEDQNVSEEQSRLGYESGYNAGINQASMDVRAQYESMISQAKQLIEDAYSEKDLIILESEAFLVELSVAIARKIINEQLAIDPSWTTRYAKNILERRREKGVITLCVSPSNFATLKESREELLMSIDSQGELVIVPDHTVDEGGCVVRTTFGTIDARIDTQLSELKSVLLEETSRQGKGQEI